MLSAQPQLPDQITPEEGQNTSRQVELRLSAANQPSAHVRIAARGKFLWVGSDKYWVRGVTYGPFHPNEQGISYPNPETVEQDFAAISANGMNSVRTYDVPPVWLLDIAQAHGLRVMVGLQVEQIASFLNDVNTVREARSRVRSRVASCAGHAALMAYVIANEIPASIVRWHGARRVESFLENLHAVGREEDPKALFCYANYPTTEYLDLPFLDLLCFNVYLESQKKLEAYLARLQVLAGNRPLLMTELGLDSRGNGPGKQAEVLGWQVRTAFRAGCAGSFVFAWTDDWYSRGEDVKDWEFGLTDRTRHAKPALAVVRQAYAQAPFPEKLRWPRISVVVCTYNGGRTIRDCLEGLKKLNYPNYEVIVVNDGSKDGSGEIASQYGVRVINTENRGLSAARNTGMNAATGEYVAYIDDDAAPDPDWLSYLAATFRETDCAAVGGPNLPFQNDGVVASCVAHAPGGPTPVLISDTEAEHIAGCNMAFRKSSLLAVDGFDPQFRAAGDDVDICWKLRQRGGKLAFCPAAVVWHHYRGSVRAYWKQQAGYGKAEALLERKWPEKFNLAGQITWGGTIYNNGLLRMLQGRQGRIYQGTWGSAAYARLYYPPPGRVQSLLLMPEWYLIVLALAVLAGIGHLWWSMPVLSVIPLLAVVLPLAAAIRSALRLRFTPEPATRRLRWRMRLLTAFLHPVQLLARATGRMRFGLTPWRSRKMGSMILPLRRTLWLLSTEWQDRIDRLLSIESFLLSKGAVVRRGGWFDGWDLEVRTGTLGSMLMVMAEEYSKGNQLVRVRAWPKLSAAATTLVFSFALLSLVAALDQAGAAAVVLVTAAVLIGALLLSDCAAAAAQLQRSLTEYGFSERNN